MSTLWRRYYRRTELELLGSFFLSVICVSTAAFARALLGTFGVTLAFATFFPAVLLAVLVGGRSAGLLAIPLSIIVVWWAFTEPFYEFGKVTPVQFANFTLFTFTGLLVVWLATAHRNLVFDLQDKERERDLLVREIEHRSKNIMAVIASLVRQTVTDKDTAEKLINRMQVAADNEDLLDPSKGGATSLRHLFMASMQTLYGNDRILLDGPDIELSAQQARSLRLVFHEMTTNALKYGALSAPDGKVKLNWSQNGNAVSITWREYDGPKVSAPIKHNFGSKLIIATLKQMDATLEPTFAETGYCYRISFKPG